MLGDVMIDERTLDLRGLVSEDLSVRDFAVYHWEEARPDGWVELSATSQEMDIDILVRITSHGNGEYITAEMRFDDEDYPYPFKRDYRMRWFHRALRRQLPWSLERAVRTYVYEALVL